MGLWLTLLPLATQLQTRSPTDESCTQKLSVWSPALPQVEVKDRKFMNTFMEPSEYRGKPNSQLEAAWDALWNSEWPDFHICIELTDILLQLGSFEYLMRTYLCSTNLF